MKHAAFLEDGVYKGISPYEYHSWGLNKERPENGPISCSQLKDFVNLQPFGWRHSAPRKSSKAMAWGSLVDSLLFTPGVEEFAFKEDNPHKAPSDGAARSKAAKMWEAEQILEEKTIVSGALYDEAIIAVERLKATPASAKILDGANYQVALVHTDPKFQSIPIKGLVDVLPHELDSDDCIADLKTTSVSLYSDRELQRQIFKFGYHIQAALYLMLWNNLTADYRNRWKIIWQKSTPPYEVRVQELTQEIIALGEAFIADELDYFARCLKTRTFKSHFESGETYVDLPDWALLEFDERRERNSLKTYPVVT